MCDVMCKDAGPNIGRKIIAAIVIPVVFFAGAYLGYKYRPLNDLGWVMFDVARKQEVTIFGHTIKRDAEKNCLILRGTKTWCKE